MDAIKQWMICVIVCSISAAVVFLLSSDSGTKRAIKTVVSVFMICAFLSPIIGGKTIKIDEGLFDFSSNEENLGEIISEELLNTAKAEAENKIIELLNGMEIDDYYIEVETDVNENNEIYVSSVLIELNRKYTSRGKQIKSNISEMFGTEAEIYWRKK